MTIGDVRRIYEDTVMSKQGAEPTLTPTGWGLLVMENEERIKTEVKLRLIDYYSTPAGREEIARSPHAHLPVGEAVELLMRDVHGWINADIIRLTGGQDDSTS